MTLIQIIDSARFLLNEDLDSGRTFPDNTSSFFKDDTLQRYVNIIQEEVQNEMVMSYEDYFLTSIFLPIEGGCAAYTLASGTMKVRRVEDVRGSDQNSTELRPVTINHKETNSFELNSSILVGGGYYLRGNEIVLTSTPSFTDASAIQVHFVKKAADLVAASAVSEIPPEHHGTIVYGVLKMGLFQQQADSTKAELEYERRLIRLKGYAETRQIQRPRLVKSTYGDDD